ncbi:hypothetical protein CEXT_206001 [Caerostris extrusa]|uniref:Uncharacterized protein n=1 Tax=Caerostris extrusa TaxID=172846 RepID=A0AAV4TRZ5_CAEEX|nr:hypothetical protein CEXT_206001 [Caerostris extrusa]
MKLNLRLSSLFYHHHVLHLIVTPDLKKNDDNCSFQCIFVDLCFCYSIRSIPSNIPFSPVSTASFLGVFGTSFFCFSVTSSTVLHCDLCVPSCHQLFTIVIPACLDVMSCSPL